MTIGVGVTIGVGMAGGVGEDTGTGVTDCTGVAACAGQVASVGKAVGVGVTNGEAANAPDVSVGPRSRPEAGCASSADGKMIAHTEPGSTQMATIPHRQTATIAVADTRIQCQNGFTHVQAERPLLVRPPA